MFPNKRSLVNEAVREIEAAGGRLRLAVAFRNLAQGGHLDLALEMRAHLADAARPVEEAPAELPAPDYCVLAARHDPATIVGLLAVAVANRVPA